MNTFQACKYLIFEKEMIDKRCKLIPLPGNIGVYWERPPELVPEDSPQTKNVQFCKMRGRLNSKVACMKGMAECGLYENVEHSVEI